MAHLGEFEPLPAVRFNTEFVDGYEWIVARPPRKWFLILFLAVWLVMWTSGGGSVISEVTAGEVSVFLFAWLIGWAAACVMVLLLLAWQFTGRLRLSVDGQALIYCWSLLHFTRTKRYDTQQIRALKTNSLVAQNSHYAHSNSSLPFLPGSTGSIQFDYGGRSVTIMPGFDGSESRLMVNWLAKRLPAAASALRQD